MKTLKYLGLFLVLTLTIISCGNSEDPERATKLEEAGKVHDEGLALAVEVKTMIAEAEELISQLGEDQKEEAVPHIESVDALKEDYESWEGTLKEVPGHAHAHHEGEGHHHNHDHSMDNASADDIIKKQEESKDFIADAHNRATKTVEILQEMIDAE
ncbi:MAG: hypothetical protein AB8G11_13550 [Saprospiraceae bacterium]